MLLVVTPKVARRLLDASGLSNQCGMRCPDGQDHQAKVDRLAAIMSAGQWESVTPLTFITIGSTLCDGVHRCAAVIKSGVTITFPVVAVF